MLPHAITIIGESYLRSREHSPWAFVKLQLSSRRVSKIGQESKSVLWISSVLDGFIHPTLSRIQLDGADPEDKHVGY